MHKPGDVILGGLFEVHYTSVFPELTFTSEPNQLNCQGFDPPGFRHAMTMAFAIDEINKNSNLLPNVTLGYSLYDNCATLVIGLSAALSLASGQEEQFPPQENCLGTPPVLGIVLAMIQILKRFGWTWTGLLVSDDDYGRYVARSFQSDLAQSGGGCLAYLEILPWGDNPAELRRIVEVMKKSTARVVIVFAHQIHMIQLMEEVVRQNVTGLQWMASEAWTSAAVLQTPHLMPYLGGTLGWVEAGGALCTGLEDLENVETEFLDVSNLRPEYNIYKAVYALAYALDEMLRCVPERGPFSGHSCATLQRLEPWQV
ncbi:hypothetical protein EPR50_G00024680 [Perca flavescens]|uniref:Receptor ligand binding region domain-containing protein n=1 Tax=Perca flavescens TaxID=8167 RepID=A0A484DI22_PERFV|nr:hypothetical protein EPR50_G00024680 [Perca flavescens]